VYHVLVVDDSAMSRKMLCKILKKDHHTCEEAEDGAWAVETAQAKLAGGGGFFDAILMDFVMPNMDGPDATAAIRTLGVSCPIFGVTGASTIRTQHCIARLLTTHCALLHADREHFGPRREALRGQRSHGRVRKTVRHGAFHQRHACVDGAEGNAVTDPPRYSVRQEVTRHVILGNNKLYLPHCFVLGIELQILRSVIHAYNIKNPVPIRVE
jgi:CheY-like chemotaxis protein